MARNQKQTQESKPNLTLHDIPLAYIIGDVINIEFINTRYKWIQLRKSFFFRLWLDIGFVQSLVSLVGDSRLSPENPGIGGSL